jgi:hypothetical protein
VFLFLGFYFAHVNFQISVALHFVWYKFSLAQPAVVIAFFFRRQEELFAHFVGFTRIVF